MAYYKENGIPVPVHNATRRDTSVVVHQPMEFQMRSANNGYTINGMYAVAPSAPTIDFDYFSECYSVAYGKCLSRYNSEVSQLGEVIAESRASLADIARLAKTIAKAYEEGCKGLVKHLTEDYIIPGRIPKGRGRKRQRPDLDVMRMMRDYWFSWSFGVMPLVNDVKSIAEALASLQDEARQFRRVSGSHRTTGRISASADDWADGWPYYVKFKGCTTHRRSQTVKVGGTLFKADLGLPGFARRNGTQLKDAIPALYQLMPYSWLIDYALNLGDLLDYYCSGEMFLHSPYMVNITEHETRWTAVPTVDTQWVKLLSYREGAVSHTCFSFNRSAWNPTSLPKLVIRVPSGLGKLVNSAGVAFEPVRNFLSNGNLKRRNI